MENSTDSSPLLLAIDTSSGHASVVVWKSGIIASGQDDTPGQQSRTLVPLIESVLAQAGKEYAGCDATACCIGPGGFTSIRVGLTVARSVALVTGKPLIGVNALEVMAYASGFDGNVVAAINASRGQYYAQRFRVNGLPVAQSEPLLIEASALGALAHGAKKATQPFGAAEVAALAESYWKTGRREFPSDPLYIREPDAKLPA